MNKEVYRALCSKEASIPFFCLDWWLDVVAGENNWDVAIAMKGQNAVAAMPYLLKRQMGFTYITMPPLTQTLGPWIRPGHAKYAKKLGQQKDLMIQLINQLPRFDYFLQSWEYSQTNWLPFYWNGFQQTTRYTYVIEDLSDLDKVWSGFAENIRREIRKSKNRFNLSVNDNPSIAEFIQLNKKVFARQNMKMPHNEELILNLDQACVERNARKMFIAVDEEGRPHAGVYIIWNQHSAYYLMGGGDPELRNSGATSLCMWEAIKFASTVTMKFDFEGSMIEPVERFFRAFGGKQKSYYSISKVPSRLLRIKAGILSLRG
jgi:hypothetical protein